MARGSGKNVLSEMTNEKIGICPVPFLGRIHMIH